MTLRRTARTLLNALSGRALDSLFGWRHKRRWLDANGLGGMHQSYFTAYRDRLPVATTIAGLLQRSRAQHPSIIEFGCSGGNNLKLLREQIATPLRYCGLDIQKDAIAFARQHFPDDTFLVCSTEDLPQLRSKLPRADVLLVSGVLYYLPEKQAQKVIDFAAAVADRLVVCDILERLEQNTGTNDGLFLHPFRRMCEEAGLQILEPPRPPRAGDRHGIFVASARPLATEPLPRSDMAQAQDDAS